MKKILFYTLLSLLSTVSVAQIGMADYIMKPSDGYYVTFKNDTLEAKFWLPEDGKGHRINFWKIRHIIMSHDANDKPFGLYPDSAKTAIAFNESSGKLHLSSYEYELGKYCFVQCLVDGRLSLFEVPETVTEPSALKIEGNIMDVPSGDKFATLSYLVKLEGAKALYCGASLFKCRDNLADYLKDYPDFTKLLLVKRRDWKFKSDIDVINTFNKIHLNK